MPKDIYLVYCAFFSKYAYFLPADVMEFLEKYKICPKI